MNVVTDTVTLSGVSDEEFRGFFVQARTVADSTRVGTFGVAEASNSRLSSCPTATVRFVYSDLLL